jgi:hypothetical protein
MARFFEQKLNFSLFYQNLIGKLGKRFSKNSKRKWFRRVETIIKCSRRLIFDHLLAVNPCGLQAKKEDFQSPTVKSRSNQIWISLFKAIDLAVHRWSQMDKKIAKRLLLLFLQRNQSISRWG